MKCRNCRREIEENSIFCNWCGAKQITERKKRKTTLVPKPRRLPSGKWFIQLRLNGKSISVSAKTEAEVISKARAIKDGFLNTPVTTPTFVEAIDSYIDKKKNILSPTTIRTYRIMQRNRFQAYADIPMDLVDWQAAVNDEALRLAPKTLKSSWRFVASLLKASNINIPSIILPPVLPHEREWLDYSQILKFIKVCKNQPCEIGALLALHGLRRSELCALTWDDVDLIGRKIHVHGAVVPDENNKFVYKKTNKNISSVRTVPIMIPELLSALAVCERNSKFIVEMHPDTLRKHINRLCQANDLPLVGVHGLRHSFASLGYHLRMAEEDVMALGGWSNYDTIHNVYLHLAAQDKLDAANKMAEFYASK